MTRKVVAARALGASLLMVPCVLACNVLTRSVAKKEAETGAPAGTARPAESAPPSPAAAPAQENACVTAPCHAALLKGKTVHPIAESCDTCHEAVATPHPQKGVKGFKLTQEPPDLCATCHDVLNGKVVHPPAKEGMCTVCHDPHSTQEDTLLRASQRELCGTCHGDHLDFKVVHGPVSVGACTACHAAHASPNEKLVLKPQEELCTGCHPDMRDVLKRKNVHPALSGGCTSCHNPHGAPNPKLLVEEGEKLCSLCHSDIAEIVDQAPVPHPAVAMGCPSCHSPHASDFEKLLADPVKDVCVGCHTDVVPKNATVLHGPDNDGRCTRCHQPHGSKYPSLLANTFPSEAYVPYTDGEFPLCFGCHKRDIVQLAQTSSTNFRDGDKNLHFVHVHDSQKARSCRLCHYVHGTSGPMLIADTVPFGKWSLPLKFVKTETGGGCSPGCHKPRFYDRKNPGKKPEATKASERG